MQDLGYEFDFSEFNKVVKGKTAPLFNKALSNKVYLPPSAYETCFISTAHDSDIMEIAIESLCDALKKI